VVLGSLDWILVWELPLLLFRIPSASNEIKEELYVKNIAARIVVFGWTLVAGCVLLLVAIPKPMRLSSWFPNPQSFRVLLVLLMLLSVLYGVGWLYRQGMNIRRQK
jgi:hypothetical protein